MKPCSIYIHIPFCVRRCGYCDFNTYAGQESLIPHYTNALCKEIRCTGQSNGSNFPVHTVFFGGGTPSLLSIQQLGQILLAVNEVFEIVPDSEITLEANPGTVSEGYLASLRALGFNRLSLGVQSAHPGELKLLERLHDYPMVIQTVKWARQAGFDNLNLDLIFGLSAQQLKTWQNSLELALGLHPEHLSLYALSIEEETPFGCWAKRGLIPIPDPDLAADMYEWACVSLEKHGYAQYEISNWAFDPQAAQNLAPGAPIHACQHNLQYWRNLPYLGFGAGAHGYFDGHRTVNVLTPTEYFRRLSKKKKKFVSPATPATQILTPINLETEIGETMMTGLRLVREGISERRFLKRFECSLEGLFQNQISRLMNAGLLEWAEFDGDRHLRLTGKGRLLGNQVFSEFI